MVWEQTELILFLNFVFDNSSYMIEIDVTDLNIFSFKLEQETLSITIETLTDC